MMDDREFRTLYRQTFAQVRCPARAAQAAAARPRRRPGWRLAVCLAAPLLLAAGVLASEATFTNLREDPRPSFAPQANTGYAVSLPYRTFPADTLGKELREDLLDFQDENRGSGEEQNGISVGGYNLLFKYAYRKYGSQYFEQWQDLLEYTGLPLLRNELLEDMVPSGDITQVIYQRDAKGLRVKDDRGRAIIQSIKELPLYLQLVEDNETSRTQININWSCKSEKDMNVQLNIQAFAVSEGESPVEGILNHLDSQKRSGLTWDAELYTLSTGDVAVLPICTSNPERFGNGGLAYFSHDGILYAIKVYGYGYETTTAQRTEFLKEILDSFSVDTAQ